MFFLTNSDWEKRCESHDSVSTTSSHYFCSDFHVFWALSCVLLKAEVHSWPWKQLLNARQTPSAHEAPEQPRLFPRSRMNFWWGESQLDVTVKYWPNTNSLTKYCRWHGRGYATMLFVGCYYHVHSLYVTISPAVASAAPHLNMTEIHVQDQTYFLFMHWRANITGDFLLVLRIHVINYKTFSFYWWKQRRCLVFMVKKRWFFPHFENIFQDIMAMSNVIYCHLYHVHLVITVFNSQF